MFAAMAWMTVLGGLLSGGPLDATLRDSQNAPTRLARFRGKPTVVFYEDRTTQHQNDLFKRELWERGRALHLTQTTNVVAVADLRRYDFFPVRLVALQHIRDVEKHHNIPVLVDWNGALNAAPWNLPRQASSVVVLDEGGRPVYVHSGPLGQAEAEAAFQTLAKLLKVELPGSAGGTR